MTKKTPTLLRIIFLVSLAATLGSLYIWYRWDPLVNRGTGIWFNRLNGLPACDMCRYMRIFQYPLVFISGIALLTKDTSSIKYIRPLALGWLLVSVYKWSLESGWIAESWICMSEISCATPTNLWWFISLPLLGVLAFLTILLVCFISLTSKH